MTGLACCFRVKGRFRGWRLWELVTVFESLVLTLEATNPITPDLKIKPQSS